MAISLCLIRRKFYEEFILVLRISSLIILIIHVLLIEHVIALLCINNQGNGISWLSHGSLFSFLLCKYYTRVHSSTITPFHLHKKLHVYVYGTHVINHLNETHNAKVVDDTKGHCVCMKGSCVQRNFYFERHSEHRFF